MIQLKNIVKTYDAGNRKFNALDGVSLDIQDGEMVAVMGPSGSGKSTLLNIIGGMDMATEGEYMYDDINVTKMKNKDLHIFRRDNISFVFQHFALMNRYTVYENVEVPLIAAHVNPLKRQETVMNQLERLGIEDQVKKYPTQLSGGQQQRCAIARALAANHRLILADEPTGALDVSTGNEIMEIFREIKDEGKTVVIITHDNGVAAKCDRILKIVDGKLTKV